MPDPYQRVKPGQPFRFPAALYNQLVDLVQAGGEPGPGREAKSAQATVVKVKNESGAGVSRGGVLGLGAPVILPTDSVTQPGGPVTFRGTTPTAANHTGKFCALLDPLEPGAVGRAVVSGVARVRLSVPGATPARADVADGQTGYLAGSATGSARVLWAESSGAVRWADVRLGEPQGAGSLVVGNATGSIAYPSVSVIEFDEADGFSLSLPSAGVARVDILAAGVGQTGVVTAAAQTLDGTKTFLDGADVDDRLRVVADDSVTGLPDSAYYMQWSMTHQAGGPFPETVGSDVIQYTTSGYSGAAPTLRVEHSYAQGTVNWSFQGVGSGILLFGAGTVADSAQLTLSALGGAAYAIYTGTGPTWTGATTPGVFPAFVGGLYVGGGSIPVSAGGTGAGSLTSGQLLVGGGTGAVTTTNTVDGGTWP